MSMTSALESTPASFATVVPATFSLEEYEHMIHCGAFVGEHEKNIELLWGRLVEMAPIGLPHEDDTDFLNEWSMRATLDKRIRVRIQNSIRLPESQSAPQPDVCWVRERSYAKRAPYPEDILLLIEVADSSLAKDRGAKCAAYAQAGIEEFWIVNLVDAQLEVYREPVGLEYRSRSDYKGDERVSPLALPEAELRAGDLFERA